MVKIFTSQDVFIGEFDGMMTTEQLLSSGVPFSRIRKYVEDGTLIRLQRGIYITKEAMDVRATGAIVILDDLANDPNIPLHGRTIIWNVISQLEVISQQN